MQVFIDQPPGVKAGLVGLALALLALAAWLAYGLFQARSLIRREFTAYFVSPIAYAVLVVFLAVTGFLFSQAFGLLTATGPRGTDFPWRAMFADERFWLVFLVIPPLLTMRLFAEERASGTLEALMTSPLTDGQIVLAKYAACLAFYVVLWLPTLLYVPALQGAMWNEEQYAMAVTPFSLGVLIGLACFVAGGLMLLPRLGTGLRVVSLVLFVGGGVSAAWCGAFHAAYDAERLVSIPVLIDPNPALATYLGLFLAGAMFLSLGLLVSSLVRDQLVAAILAVALSLPFILAGFLKPESGDGLTGKLVYFFSVPLHFDRAFTRGVIDSQPIILYASTAAFCLFLTVRSLESRRWQ